MDDQLGHVIAGAVRQEGRRGRERIAQHRLATVRRAHQGPLIAQGTAVRIAGPGAVQVDRGAGEGGLVGAGIGDGPTVDGADGHRVGIAVELSVTDDELGDIGTWPIDGECGGRGVRGGKRGGASFGYGGQGPVIAENVAVRIKRTRPVELDQGADRHALVRTRGRNGSAVEGGNDDRIRVAVGGSVVDDELDHVRAGPVHGENGLNRRGVGQGRGAALRLIDQGPAVSQAVAVQIGGTAAVQGDGVADVDALIGARLGDRF